jgi:hypothetical protein
MNRSIGTYVAIFICDTLCNPAQSLFKTKSPRYFIFMLCSFLIIPHQSLSFLPYCDHPSPLLTVLNNNIQSITSIYSLTVFSTRTFFVLSRYCNEVCARTYTPPMRSKILLKSSTERSSIVSSFENPYSPLI